MPFLRDLFSSLTTSEAFERDWYGWAANQVSHTALGIFSVWAICYGAFMVFGTFPYRLQVFWLILALYSLKEIGLDKWNGFDTVEDVLFFAFYGAGGTLFAFKEVTSGDALVALDAAAVVPVFAVFAVHLLTGVFKRWSAANA